MIYVSIDIETTGTDRQNDQILEFGAIIEDTTKELPFEEVPKFEAILLHDRLHGNPYALNMNARLIEILANIPPEKTQAKEDYIKKYNIVNPKTLSNKFAVFLRKHLGLPEFDINEREWPATEIVVAGKNFESFDKQFLLNLPYFEGFIKFNRRSINVAEYFIDFQNDIQPPSLDECLRRAGFENKVNHKALDDAWDVIKLLRTQYHRSYKNR